MPVVADPTTLLVADRDVRRACRWVDECGVLPVITEDMTAGTGRPRAQSWRAILVLLLLTATSRPDRLHLARAARIAAGLTARQRDLVGIHGDVTYSQIESAFADLAAGMRPRVNRRTGEVLPARISMDSDALLSRLGCGAIPKSIPAHDEFALDSTDSETWARRRTYSKDGMPDLPDGATDPDAALVAEAKKRARQSNRRVTGSPSRGADGRFIHSRDADAREGWRTSRNGELPVFLGYDVHLLCDVTSWGGPSVPPLVRALSVAPAGTRKSEPGHATIASARALGHDVRRVLVDRGYSQLLATNWAEPLARAGVQQVFDLHANQITTRPGPAPGTIMIAGGLFSDAIPNRLRSLERRVQGMSRREQLALSKQYDDRAVYAFRPVGAPKGDGTKQQYEGPARAGKLRCPNHPQSMRLSASKHPTTECEPGIPCSCGARITVDKTYIRERQRHLWGTTRWLADYGRRNSVESANSMLKTHTAGFRRGSIRVFGLEKSSIWLAMVVAAINIHLLASRYRIEPADPAPSATPPIERRPGTAPLHQIVGQRGPPSQALKALQQQPDNA